MNEGKLIVYSDELLTDSSKRIYAITDLPGTEDWLYHQAGLEPYVVSERRIRLVRQRLDN